MTDFAVVTTVQPLDDHWLRIAFADGEVHEIDLGPMLSRGGVFSPIYADRALFAAVRVDDEFGTIVWPGDVDLDPDVLRGTHPPASGVPIPRRVVRSASLTSM